jgi:hypothetical protein
MYIHTYEDQLVSLESPGTSAHSLPRLPPDFPTRVPYPRSTRERVVIDKVDRWSLTKAMAIYNGPSRPWSASWILTDESSVTMTMETPSPVAGAMLKNLESPALTTPVL